MKIRLKRVIFPLPGREIELDVVDDVESLITDLSDADQVPCWAEIWPAARALARYIWEHVDISGKSVIELGCGLGLPGTVSALKGAGVTFSDYNPDAVQLSINNSLINHTTAKGHVGDWRSFKQEEKFDWIIGSDVFYDPKLNPYVLEIFFRNLKPDGQLLLSHQRRQPTYDFVRKVMERLQMQEIRLDVIETDMDSVYQKFPISIHHLLRV